MDATALSSRGLTKRFGALTAVDAVDLDVPAGAVYGFLGPNGSGKTTTIRMLLGLVRPSAGTHSLLGADVAASPRVLERVGTLVEGPAFHATLTARANLVRLDAADRGSDGATAGRRVDAALERVGLTAAARTRYRAFSLGMRQRLGLAAALLRPRDLLVLDEPTNGLDPQGTREVRAIVGELAAGGTTVFLSSHLLAEVEQLCDHVGVMSRGRLVWQGPMDGLREDGDTRVRVGTGDPAAAARVLAGLGLTDVTADADGVAARLGTTAVEDVVAALVHAGVGVRAVRADRPTLEERFVGLTGEGFDVSR